MCEKRGSYICFINSQHIQSVFKKMKSFLPRATSGEELASPGVITAFKL